MRLTDLEPRWIGNAHRDGTKFGLTFCCPHCRGCRLSVLFRPVIGLLNEPEGDASHPTAEHTWNRTAGETFDDLTLAPSIDASKAGHWHGFITSGEIT